MAIYNVAYRILVTGSLVWGVTLVLLFICARFFPDHLGTVVIAHLAADAVILLMLLVMVLTFAVERFRERYGARRTGPGALNV
jgi:hypothetical protein